MMLQNRYKWRVFTPIKLANKIQIWKLSKLPSIYNILTRLEKISSTIKNSKEFIKFLLGLDTKKDMSRFEDDYLKNKEPHFFKFGSSLRFFFLQKIAEHSSIFV